MKIKISADVYKLHKSQFAELNIVDTDKVHWQDFYHVDMTGRDPAVADRIIELLMPHKGVKGINAAIRDLRSWLAMHNTNGDLPKARSCETAAQLLKAYIERSERRHIYQTTSGEDGSAALPYYVEKIEYSPGERDNPPSTNIRLRYVKFGELNRCSVSFETEDVRGKTPEEILSDAGWQLETLPLRDDYEFYLEKYESIALDVGAQFLAVGTGQTVNSRYWRDELKMEDDEGRPSKVVIDVFSEEGKSSSRNKTETASGHFWQPKVDPDADPDNDPPVFIPDVPIHPYAVVFHLRKHTRLSVHVQNLTRYIYNETVRESLILPDRDQALLDVLLADSKVKYSDVIGGKTGGVVILCQGPPGTGKTLTAEVYAESMRRPLYTVQCSQLGIDAETLEKELLTVFARANRWGALLLLDEADVYIHERGSDLTHNAIVGVFLRVLEYYDGILFMTTNRGDTVDDAILSRCTARIEYGVPCLDHQARIWCKLAKANNAELGQMEIAEIVNANSDLSGRDIKNLLKLCLMVKSHQGNPPITARLVSEMRRFKPTMSVSKVE